MRRRHERELRKFKWMRYRRCGRYGRYKQYTREEMSAALQEVSGGEKIIKTARKFDIPTRTLYDRVKKMKRRETELQADHDKSERQDLDPEDIHLEDYSESFESCPDPFDVLELVIDLSDEK